MAIHPMTCPPSIAVLDVTGPEYAHHVSDGEIKYKRIHKIVFANSSRMLGSGMTSLTLVPPSHFTVCDSKATGPFVSPEAL